MNENDLSDAVTGTVAGALYRNYYITTNVFLTTETSMLVN